MNKYNLQYYIPDPKCVSDILIRRRTLTNRLNRFSTTDVILFNTLTCFFPAFLNASACYLYYYQSGTTGVLRCTAVASSLQQLCKTTFIHLLLNREILKFITVVFIFDFFLLQKNQFISCISLVYSKNDKQVIALGTVTKHFFGVFTLDNITFI